MTAPSPPDLISLTRQATKQAARDASRPLGPPPGARRRPVLTGLTGVALLVATYLVYHQLAPPGPASIARDLDATVEQARASIEASRAATGQLPEALPSAALRSVVRYEPQDDRYQLSATILGVRVTLRPDGAKQIEHGVAP